MALMEISIVPLGTGNTSLSPYIAKVIRAIKESGLSYEFHDMGTTIQGEVGELFGLAQTVHEIPFDAGAKRVYTVIKIDDRRDKITKIGQKRRSVEKKL